MCTSIRPVAALAVLMAVLVGCSSFAPAAVTPAPPAAMEATHGEVAPHPPDPPASETAVRAAVPDPLAASFTALADQIPGQVGIALSDGQRSILFGDWDSGPAWSTIKVPLSIAALRLDPNTATPLMQRAISQSDNAAAEQLWSLLGDPTAAATAVRGILAEGANNEVVVQAEQVRPPYSAFGQTLWSLADAARFAWALPCIANSETVLVQMHNLTADQRWGLAASGDVAAKGGWGPDLDGNYLTRQIAVVATDTGTLGVALAAQPDDGNFTTATSMIDRLADWIAQHTNEFPSSQCASPS